MRSMRLSAALAAALGVCGFAAAQNVPANIDYNANGFSVRGGVAVPLDSTLSDLGSTLIDIGVEWTFPTPLLANGETYLSADYFGKGIKFDKGSVIPLAINQRIYNRGDEQGQRTYYFFGVGIAFIDVDTSGTAALARAGFGKELGLNTFFETAGYISDRGGGARANSITFNLGYRF